MSIVWAYIKDKKGFIFSDGLVKHKNGKIEYCVNKTFNFFNGNDTSIIGGFTWEYKECQLDSIINLIKEISPKINCVENFIKQLITNFNKNGYFNQTNKDSWYLLVIFNNTHILKFSYSNNNLYHNETIEYNGSIVSQSIGDYNSYKCRMFLFNKILEMENVKYKDAKNLFRLKKKYVCTDDVGGKTFHQKMK